jgi:bifunctional non-homologous end joining protein LigD
MPPAARAGTPRAPVRKSASRRAAAAEPAGAALREYEAKRAFDVTSEPPPAEAPARHGPLLFVVQQHAARRMHWDFRLELDGVLKSWAVPKAPSLDPADRRLAVQTEDHPFEYASFEGVIPAKQYGAGEVIVWDCGVYSPDEDDRCWFHDRDAAQQQLRDGLARGKLSIFLRGVKLKGSFTLVHTKEPKNWFLIKHRDRFAGQGEVTVRDTSTISGMRVADLERLPAHERIDALRLAPEGPVEAFPGKLSPMLAEPGEGAFTDPGWLFEPKLDGYRALAFIDGERVELRSRRGLDLTRAFPSIVAELRAQAVQKMVLDGEIVALDAAGRPSFNALQNRAQLKTEREIAQADQQVPALFYAFDLLHFEGVNLRHAPYAARHRYLAQCVLPNRHVRMVDAHEDGAALYEAALANGFEGVMAKRRNAPYEPGRRAGTWLKIKATLSAEFVIGGYSKGKGARAALGSLLVGYWAGSRLQYAAHVGTGFDEAALTDVKARCDAVKSPRMPFADKPPRHGETVWMRPELVAEVKFAEWTPDARLRAPVFLRLRDDVDPRAVKRPSDHPLQTRAQPQPADALDDVLRQLDAKRNSVELAIGRHRLRVTNLDRVYWPEDTALGAPALTKRELLRYLTRISPYMLPHLADRPLTVIRWPEGIFGERFFQKHWEQAQPDFVQTVEVFSETKGHQDAYLVVDNLATLLWLAQFGTLEYHVWHSRSRPGPDSVSQSTDFSSSLEAMEHSVLNYPDYLVFDIDPYIYAGYEQGREEPQPNEPAFEKGKEVAFRLRELLNGMQLDPIVKTTGKTGLHVFVPIERRVTFDAVRQMSEAIGRHLMRQHPEDITMEWSVNKRTGKIFMDYNMNVRGKTLNVAYSPRGRPGAAVSVPVTWEELERVKPMDFRLTNVPDLVEARGDVWRDALTRKQSLDRALGVQGV